MRSSKVRIRGWQALRAAAARWGSVAGCTAAEAFELLRWVRLHQDRNGIRDQDFNRVIGVHDPVYIIAEAFGESPAGLRASNRDYSSRRSAQVLTL